MIIFFTISFMIRIDLRLGVYILALRKFKITVFKCINIEHGLYSLLVAFQGADSSSEAYVMVVIAKLLLGIQSRVGEALEEGVDVMCHGVVKRPKRKNRENLKIAGWTQACECGCSRCFTRLF